MTLGTAEGVGTALDPGHRLGLLECRAARPKLGPGGESRPRFPQTTFEKSHYLGLIWEFLEMISKLGPDARGRARGRAAVQFETAPVFQNTVLEVRRGRGGRIS